MLGLPGRARAPLVLCPEPAPDIGESTDIRASAMESVGSDFLTAIENVPRLLVNGPPAHKSRIMVPIRNNKRDCFLIRSKPFMALAAAKNSAAGSSPAQCFVLYEK